MDFIILATELNWIGKIIYDYLYSWVLSWGNDYAAIGAFGVTVILFSVFLRIIMSPLDVWQKLVARKSTKTMELMKPELDKATKQCGNNRELLMQKQREIHKKHKYSAFSACLPSLATMVLFIVVFTGFNSAVRYHNSQVYEELEKAYFTTYESTYNGLEGAEMSKDDKAKKATEAAEQKVLDTYKPERFLLTTNIFMPDTWKTPIPAYSDYVGTGIGKMGISSSEVNGETYDKVMKPLIQKYNVNEKGKKIWNGYLILPILSFALSIISSKLIKPPEQPAVAGQTAEQAKAQQSQAKMMQYMMPIMISVFALFYSTAFNLYMVIGNLFSTTFNVVWNIIAKRVDAKKKDQMMSTTIKN